MRNDECERPTDFEYTGSPQILPIANRGFMSGEWRRAALWTLLAASTAGVAQGQQTSSVSPTTANPGTGTVPASARFALRAEQLVQTAPVDKGEWGLLVVDASSGEMLYEKNADKYFVPASNMKLLTTALALDTLGANYRFRTTIETNGTLGADGMLRGDLFFVGRGDPNLSNRKFPFEAKEEFDGPPERVLAEMADALVARGVKEIKGDVVGDDSYFPRERYPEGWEIGDMVWEYGAAISAIAVNDNTVAVTLTPGEKAGDPVQESLEPETLEFTIKNEVGTIGAKE